MRDIQASEAKAHLPQILDEESLAIGVLTETQRDLA